MIQNILINLNILSKIKPYDKIYINKDNLITIEYNSIFQGVFRFLYNNSREKNLTNLINFYQSVYQITDELLNSQFLNKNVEFYIKEDNDDFIKVFTNLIKINKYLESSLTGINNLKKTYNSDVLTDSKLDILINNTEQYITKISKKILYYNNLIKKYNTNTKFSTNDTIENINNNLNMATQVENNNYFPNDIKNIIPLDTTFSIGEDYNNTINKDKQHNINNIKDKKNKKQNNYDSMV